jgi:CBS domain-containing protein
MAQKIQDVMTRDVEVISPDDTLRSAAEKMRDRDVGPIPVCDGQRLVGMLTDRDIVVRIIAQGKDAQSTRVSEAMSPHVEYCFAEDSLDGALRHMSSKQIRRLVVLDSNKKLVGIVSLGDLSREASEERSGEALEAISEPSSPAH